MNPEHLQQVGLALGLGLLVGLQRERTEAQTAGIRTFTLIALLGVLSGMASRDADGWITGGAFVALALVLLVGEVATWRTGRVDPGITTGVAALLTFAIGVTLAFGHTLVAVFVGGATMILLQWKHPLHRLAERIGREDFRALTRLVLLALVILPVLPNESYGPYDVLNPFEIWLMIVLIVGISLAAYVAYKLMGPTHGLLAAGTLTGLISSTAATVGFARKSGESSDYRIAAAVAIAIASTMTLVRVLLEIAIVAPSILPGTAAPLGTMLAFMALTSGGLFLAARGHLEELSPEREPPVGLGVAMIFGLLYAVVLLAVAAARDFLGEGGLYGVAGLSGLTDMNAITLSTAQLARRGEVEAGLAWKVILVGALANLVFKAGTVMVLARGRTRAMVGATFALWLAAGGLMLWLWP